MPASVCAITINQHPPKVSSRAAERSITSFPACRAQSQPSHRPQRTSIGKQDPPAFHHTSTYYTRHASPPASPYTIIPTHALRVHHSRPCPCPETIGERQWLSLHYSHPLLPPAASIPPEQFCLAPPLPPRVSHPVTGREITLSAAREQRRGDPLSARDIAVAD